MDYKRGGKLSISTNGDEAAVEIAGTGTDILFNWTALTYQVCREMGISPVILAASMPHMIADYERRQLNYSVCFRPGGKDGGAP